jgi:metal-responsive CopG/Arc/MetJ family transcriptional regulator
MANQIVELNEKLLKEFDELVKESGVSRQEFISYIAKFYNINNRTDRDTIDYSAYYESFTA